MNENGSYKNLNIIKNKLNKHQTPVTNIYEEGYFIRYKKFVEAKDIVEIYESSQILKLFFNKIRENDINPIDISYMNLNILIDHCIIYLEHDQATFKLIMNLYDLLSGIGWYLSPCNPFDKYPKLFELIKRHIESGNGNVIASIFEFIQFTLDEKGRFFNEDALKILNLDIVKNLIEDENTSFIVKESISNFIYTLCLRDIKINTAYTLVTFIRKMLNNSDDESCYASCWGLYNLIAKFKINLKNNIIENNFGDAFSRCLSFSIDKLNDIIFLLIGCISFLYINIEKIPYDKLVIKDNFTSNSPNIKTHLLFCLSNLFYLCMSSNNIDQEKIGYIKEMIDYTIEYILYGEFEVSYYSARIFPKMFLSFEPFYLSDSLSNKYSLIHTLLKTINKVLTFEITLDVFDDAITVVEKTLKFAQDNNNVQTFINSFFELDIISTINSFQEENYSKLPTRLDFIKSIL